MDRRELLSVTGIIVGTALSGCVSRAPGESEAQQTDPSPTPATSTDTETLNIDDDGYVHGFPMYKTANETATIGSRDEVSKPESNRPHWLTIWNPAGRKRQIGITVSERSDGDGAMLLDEVYEIPPDGIVRVQLSEPATYRATIDGPENDEVTTIDIPRRRFTCNKFRHKITVTPTGDILVNVFKTNMACDVGTKNP